MLDAAAAPQGDLLTTQCTLSSVCMRAWNAPFFIQSLAPRDREAIMTQTALTFSGY